MACAQVKFLRRFVILVNNPAIGSRQIDRAGNDGFKHGFEFQTGTDRLADFAQRFHFLDGFNQLARAFLQFLEQPHVLDGDHRLVGESFEKSNLLV